MKILITGGSGTVARPVAESLAADHEVWCLGRFGDDDVRSQLESVGIRTHRWDLGDVDLTGVPDDFTHVFHAAVLKGVDDIDTQIDVNGSAAAALMSHCRRLEAFLFASASAVYQPADPRHLHREDDPLGGSSPYLASYATQKVGTEAVVRSLAKVLGIPSIIGRLSVTYGSFGYGGLPSRFFEMMLAGAPIPVPIGHDNWCSPLHTDDVARHVPLLWAAATVPATVVNWAGDEAVSQREMMAYVAELTDVPVSFAESDHNRRSCALDPTRRISITGPCLVPWQEGLRRTIGARFPDHLATTS